MTTPDLISDLLKAANDASGRAFALWVTFLTVMAYLALAIGTTTDVQLLLKGPVKLPLLGVDLPLFSFYGFSPPIFAVFHLYILMQLYLLSQPLQVLDEKLELATEMGPDDLRVIRAQLDKFVLTQLLIATPAPRVMRMLLRGVVRLSFVTAPILLLLAFQLRFLPYHSVFVSYIHRLTLVMDLIILWLMWPQIAQGTKVVGYDYQMKLGGLRMITGFSTICIFFLVIVPEYLTPAHLQIPLDAQLVEPDRDKLSKLDRTISLRGRNLRFAEMAGVNLKKSDMRKADLTHANLVFARLDGANLSLVELNEASLANATLIGATISSTGLNHAFLREADLSGADLGGDGLRNADLVDANLSGASLFNARLAGASLTRANISGASLTLTDLRGATLAYANVSNITYATEANFGNADLSGANSSNADLHDAGNLSQPQLDNACGDDRTKLPSGLTISVVLRTGVSQI